MLERINPSKVGLCEERLERVTDWLDQQIESQRLAGASVLVARHGSIGYLHAAVWRTSNKRSRLLETPWCAFFR